MQAERFMPPSVVIQSWCLLLLLQRNSAGSENPSDAFRFLVEDRTQCCQSRRVRYTQRVDYCIQLPAPIEAATNRGNGVHIRTVKRPPTLCWCSLRPQLPLQGIAFISMPSRAACSMENYQILLWTDAEGPRWRAVWSEWGETCWH